MADESRLEDDICDLRGPMLRVETIAAGLVKREDLANFRFSARSVRPKARDWPSTWHLITARAILSRRKECRPSSQTS